MATPGQTMSNTDGTPIMGVDANGNAQHIQVSAGGAIAAPSADEMLVGQNALSTSNEKVLDANPAAFKRLVTNLDGSINVFIGFNNTLTTANGHRLNPGATLDLSGYTGEVWAIAASGTPSVSFLEI